MNELTQEQKRVTPNVGDTVLVGSRYNTNPDTLKPIEVVAVKRKYFTARWCFHGSCEYLVDFSMETGEMKENPWISGYPKAWLTRDDCIAEIAAKERQVEDDELTRKIRAFFMGYRPLTHDQIHAIWAVVKPIAEPAAALTSPPVAAS